MLNHYQAVYVVMNVNIIYHNKINIVLKIVQTINNMKFKQKENTVFLIVTQLIIHSLMIINVYNNVHKIINQMKLLNNVKYKIVLDIIYKILVYHNVHKIPI